MLRKRSFDMDKTVTSYCLKNKRDRKEFIYGLKDGMPIALGYMAVAFALGVQAKAVGLNALQGFIMSFLNRASAGEYIGLRNIAADAAYFQIAVATLITNARYLLMSSALSQKIDPNMHYGHRFLLATTVTDELFGISIAKKGYLNPYYPYGATLIASLGWASGTALGITVGNIMPDRLVSALSVALFGMFIAVFIPKAKENKVVAVLVVICFALSFAMRSLPYVSNLDDGMITIILTVVISLGAALLFPAKDEEENGNDA